MAFLYFTCMLQTLKHIPCPIILPQDCKGHFSDVPPFVTEQTPLMSFLCLSHTHFALSFPIIFFWFYHISHSIFPPHRLFPKDHVFSCCFLFLYSLSAFSISPPHLYPLPRGDSILQSCSTPIFFIQPQNQTNWFMYLP